MRKIYSLTIYNKDGSEKWTVDVVRSPEGGLLYRVLHTPSHPTKPLVKGLSEDSVLMEFLKYENQRYLQRFPEKI